MNTHVDSETRRDRPVAGARYLPPYGPVDALLGYVLFYVVVDRVTPTVVAVAAELFPDVAPSAVQFALAAFLWFVLVVSTIDQLRRQLAALGLGSHSEVDPDPTSRTPPSEPMALVSLLGVVLGGAVAWLSFDRGLEAVVTVVDAVVRLDVGSLLVVDLAVLLVFFVGYGVATWSLDRLVVGGLRWALTD
jgi:hypothetical protein